MIKARLNDTEIQKKIQKIKQTICTIQLILCEDFLWKLNLKNNLTKF